MGNAMLLCEFPSTLWFPARHRNQDAVARSGDGWDDCAAGDPGGAQDSPTQSIRYIRTFIRSPSRAIDWAAVSITATLRRASAAGTASGSDQMMWSARLR